VIFVYRSQLRDCYILRIFLKEQTLVVRQRSIQTQKSVCITAFGDGSGVCQSDLEHFRKCCRPNWRV
jgi:hypothetical protein